MPIHLRIDVDTDLFVTVGIFCIVSHPHSNLLSLESPHHGSQSRLSFMIVFSAPLRLLSEQRRCLEATLDRPGASSASANPPSLERPSADAFLDGIPADDLLVLQRTLTVTLRVMKFPPRALSSAFLGRSATVLIANSDPLMDGISSAAEFHSSESPWCAACKRVRLKLTFQPPCLASLRSWLI